MSDFADDVDQLGYTCDRCGHEVLLCRCHADAERLGDATDDIYDARKMLGLAGRRWQCMDCFEPTNGDTDICERCGGDVEPVIQGDDTDET